MIVKIKSGDRSWNFFEGDYINQTDVDLCNTNTNEDKSTIFILLKGTRMNLKDNPYPGGKLLIIQKGQTIIARILTNRASYLMNNEGKTIEKLN